MKKLSKEQMKTVIGGRMAIPPGDGIVIECKDSCKTSTDCAVDRTCDGSTCGGVTIKSCFKY